MFQEEVESVRFAGGPEAGHARWGAVRAGDQPVRLNNEGMY